MKLGLGAVLTIIGMVWRSLSYSFRSRIRSFQQRTATAAYDGAPAIASIALTFRRLLKKHEILASSFDKLRMRSRVFKGLALMVSLSNHELVAARRAHLAFLRRLCAFKP
ncbi:MAG: hypothetical protein WBS14_05590 [Rhodomicrobium sp.]